MVYCVFPDVLGAFKKLVVSQSRKPEFESSCGRFEALAISFIRRCSSSFSCINEYLATDRGGYLNSLRTVIAAWLNASQISWDGVGMNKSARMWKVKRITWAWRLFRTFTHKSAKTGLAQGTSAVELYMWLRFIYLATDNTNITSVNKLCK